MLAVDLRTECAGFPDVELVANFAEVPEPAGSYPHSFVPAKHSPISRAAKMRTNAGSDINSSLIGVLNT